MVSARSQIKTRGSYLQSSVHSFVVFQVVEHHFKRRAFSKVCGKEVGLHHSFWHGWHAADQGSSRRFTLTKRKAILCVAEVEFLLHKVQRWIPVERRVGWGVGWDVYTTCEWIGSTWKRDECT